MASSHIALFGATGPTGIALVQQALDQGYEVTALVRTPSKLDIKHDRLHIIQGDAFNYEDVRQVVAGKEAVLSCLGTRAADKTMVRALGTEKIIQAMEAEGVRKLITLASLGYGDSEPMMPWYMTYLIIPIILKNAFKDHALQEQFVEQSTLDWVIARPASLTNGAFTGHYKEGFPVTEKIKLRISRADVAHFMLAQIPSDRYLRQKVGLSY
ncbi:MAG: SDR family oxidoreductase [Bacteroidota bacterium]